ncbi:MAG: AbiH family protein [Janthinobacterium lividum]
MNRLILIGNGFDLAHGMKTSYNDFILWYLKKCFEEADKVNTYNDEFIEIRKIHNQWSRVIKDFSDLVDYFYQENNLVGVVEQQYYDIGSTRYTNQFQGNVKSTFLRLLLSKCSNSNWVEIENEFYNQLKDILTVDIGPVNRTGYDEKYRVRLQKVQSLNASLEFIINQLNEYLFTINTEVVIDDYRDIFTSKICKAEIVIDNNLKEENESPDSTMILNFNYTKTATNYLTYNIREDDVNYIHGKIGDIDNPIIFGFGDELDSDYPKLELQKLNSFLKYIKSFWYFKTMNYHNLIRFIDRYEFQVYILGHSCGLSDRTMLNMIFEHENCKSIKIFYYVDTNGNNNYTNLTQEISRHFGLKSKGIMRKKIVPLPMSEKMPQAKP